MTLIDGLRGMGRLLRLVIEDGYRTQLRLVPWSYALMYWLLEHVPPFRLAVRSLLCALGSRPLQRQIAAHEPDVVVSTYPAVTVVLGRLRRLGLIDCPTVATITDMTGLFFWAQRGIDMHVVMYEASVPSVERIAGSGSVRVVRPLIDEQFLEPCEREVARTALDLPLDGAVIVVSGGGWGVGDLAGAVDELARIPDATVVALAGRNEEARSKLAVRFAGQPRVRVLGFTERMSELLAAADVLVHSTGGVTCLEAMARGCPVVSYGLPVGHAKVNTRAMADQELLVLARSTRELLAHVERGCSGGLRRAAAMAPAPSASEVVLNSPARVRPLPAWRPRLARLGSTLMLALSAGTWMMSTDEMNAFANMFLRVHAVRTVHTARREVAVVIRTSPAAIDGVAEYLSQHGLRASFADSTVPAKGTLQMLATLGDAPMPSIPRVRLLNWVRTRSELKREARALHIRHHFLYLQPNGGLCLGQMLMARTAGAIPVAGSVHLSASAPLPQRPLRAGDVVVVTLDGSAASLRSLEPLAAELGAERLSAVPLSSLV